MGYKRSDFGWSIPKRIARQLEDEKYDGKNRSVPSKKKKYECKFTKAGHAFELQKAHWFYLGLTKFSSDEFRCPCGKKHFKMKTEKVTQEDKEKHPSPPLFR